MTAVASNNDVKEFIGELTLQGGALRVRQLLDRKAPPIPLQCDIESLRPGDLILARGTGAGSTVSQVLAPAGSALASIYGIAADHGLDPIFPRPVAEELKELVANPRIDAEELEDLTGLPFCTIDGADTRDLDQALYIELTGNGYRIWYALADAASFVRPGSTLFEEALARGASYYLPGLVVPMLPKILSEGLVSLNPNVDRRALVFQMQLDQNGQCTETRLLRARIRSRAKLSFETVQAFLDDPQEHPIEPEDLARSLQALRTVGELRLRDRRTRDVVRYRRTEVDARIGDDPMRFVVIENLQNDVERYNEELSLLCNVEGARFLLEGDREDDHVQPIYRVHPEPDPDRMARFEETVRQLVRSHGLDPKLWEYRSSDTTTLARYLSGLPSSGPEGRIAAAIHRQAIMVNARSAFSQRAGGHYGVGADVYARFSAPMREIVGVFLHKEAVEKLDARPHTPPTSTDEALRDRIVERANEAKRLQSQITKAANRFAIDQVFLDGQASEPKGDGPRFSATVMGMAKDRVYLRLDRPVVEVKAYLRDLAQDRGERLAIDDAGVELRARESGMLLCRLGDPVRIHVTGRDARRDRWILRLEKS